MEAVDLGDPQTLNLYSYCTNDPINHVDPEGLFFKKLFKWIGKALKILGIVALVVMTVIWLAPVSSFAFKAALWMFSNVLLPLSQIPVLGVFVPLGSLSNPPWNPGGRGSIFRNGFTDGRAKSNDSIVAQTAAGAIGRSLLMQGPVERKPVVQREPTERKSSFRKCFNGWRFSAAASEPFRGTRFHGVVKSAAQFLEIGPPLSLGADAAASTAKARRLGIGGSKNPYASGLNYFFRHTAASNVKGSLIKFGTKATPVISGVGAFTVGYNLSVAGQCGAGVIE